MKQLLVAVLLVLLFVIPANAQTFRGAINGTVTDPSGAAVPRSRGKGHRNCDEYRSHDSYVG